MTEADVVVLGAGAAGLFCASAAGRRGRRVVVLEHMDEPGRKILISGGGRCNFTNTGTDAANFLSANPHFAKSALARFGPHDFADLVGKHGIRYHEKKLGQLFCDRSAAEIRDLLVKECESAGVEILCRTKLNAVTKEPDGRFRVLASIGEFSCASLVVATGGLSFPRLGASDLGYRLARQFGLEIIEPEPALVPFVWSPEDLNSYGGLSGISADSLVACDGMEFRENILFTHRGLSGPAILQISSYWKPGRSVTVNLLPDGDLSGWLKAERNLGSKAELKNALQAFWPKRLCETFCAVHCPAPVLAKPVANFSDREIDHIVKVFQSWSFVPAGTEGFAKAEVTRGGVSTAGLSSKTLEARKAKGLFFIGEVVDVTGWLGGYNFQWAWASAQAAGDAA